MFSPNPQKPILELNLIAEKKHLEELLQRQKRLFDIPSAVLVVGADKCVAETTTIAQSIRHPSVTQNILAPK